MDEPSASLDPLVEYKLNNIILKELKDSTMILISHRLSTVKNFDKIVYIEDGKVIEEGTHNQLMEKKGKYYEMFTKQAEQYID